jgi:hypothetical protein
MRILTRYLLRTHLAPFLFSLSVLTGLLFVNTVARRMADLAGKGLGWSIIGEVFYLSVPHIFALTMPMAVLVSVLFTFSQLTADNEITALKASGVSLIRLLTPLIVSGIVLAGVLLWFNDYVLPESNHRLKNVLADVGRKSPTFELKEQTINPIRTGMGRSQYFLQAAAIDHQRNRLLDVVIYDMSLGQKTRTIYADSGRMAFNAAQTDLLLTLRDGWVHEADTYDSARFERAKFGTYLLEMAGIGDELTRVADTYRGDRQPVQCRVPQEVRDPVRLHHLRAARRATRRTLSARRRGHGHRHFARDLRHLLHVADRRRVAGRPRHDRPFWGRGARTFIFLAIALWALSRIGRETSSARGGGWDDLWLTIRGLCHRPFRRRRRTTARRATLGARCAALTRAPAVTA